MSNKKEFLLESIIKAYIEHLEPIGSTQLKSMYDIAYSPATIRGYFKKLGDEGYLAQEHVSSGRTPTTEALKQYWERQIKFDITELNERNIARLANEVGCSILLQEQRYDVLQNVLNVEDKYIILEFTTFSVTIKYNNALYRFIKDNINLELHDIVNIAKQVGAFEIYETVNQHLENKNFHIFNTKEFFSLALRYDLDEMRINDFLKGRIFDNLEEGIYFNEMLPEGYVGICHHCKFRDINVKMLVVGELSKDYEYLYEKIKLN